MWFSRLAIHCAACFVVVACSAGQRPVLDLPLRLSGLLGSTRFAAALVLRVQRIDALPQQFAGLVCQVARRGQGLAGLRQADAVHQAETHFPAPAARRGVAQGPGRTPCTHAQRQASAIRMVAVAGRQNLPHRQQV
jgi:hypothetical protein